MMKFPLKPFAILTSGLLMTLLSCVSMDEEKKPNIDEALNTQKKIVINHLNRGEPDKAFMELRPALQRFPENVDLKTLMGLTQLAMRNPQTAIVYLKEAHNLEPSSTTVLNLSSALIENGSNAAALKLIRKHLKNEGMSGYQFPERIYHNLGLAYLNIKKKKSAHKYFKRAIGENPKFYLSLMQLGDLQLGRKKFKTARKYYRKAMPACGQCYEAVKALSNSYLKQGKRKGAIAVLESYAKNKKIPNDFRKSAQKDIAKMSRPNNRPRVSRSNIKR